MKTSKISDCGKRVYGAVCVGNIALTGPEHENLPDDKLWAEAEAEAKRAGVESWLDSAEIGIFTERLHAIEEG